MILEAMDFAIAGRMRAVSEINCCDSADSNNTDSLSEKQKEEHGSAGTLMFFN